LRNKRTENYKRKCFTNVRYGKIRKIPEYGI